MSSKYFLIKRAVTLLLVLSIVSTTYTTFAGSIVKPSSSNSVPIANETELQQEPLIEIHEITSDSNQTVGGPNSKYPVDSPLNDTHSITSLLSAFPGPWRTRYASFKSHSSCSACQLLLKTARTTLRLFGIASAPYRSIKSRIESILIDKCTQVKHLDLNFKYYDYDFYF